VVPIEVEGHHEILRIAVLAQFVELALQVPGFGYEVGDPLFKLDGAKAHATRRLGWLRGYHIEVTLFHQGEANINTEDLTQPAAE
jgi:hypothetical protein